MADLANTPLVMARDIDLSVPRPVSIHDQHVLVDGTLQIGDVDVSFTNPIPVNDVWRVTNISNLTLDSSNKVIFTVPANTEYQVLFIRVSFVTTATVGVRQLEVRIEHPAATITGVWARSGVTQIASLTYSYLFAPGVPDFLATRVTGATVPYVATPIPIPALLYAGDVLRVLDVQAIDAAADDMLVYAQIAQRAV